MPRSFSIPSDWRARLGKDPRVIARAALGTLLLLNLVAAYAVLQPLGGSAEDLEQELSARQSELHQRQRAMTRLRQLVSKIETARTAGDTFLTQYFLEGRTASSSIIGEITLAAKDAGIQPREHTYSFDPIEGSDTLGMLTVDGNYQGTYRDLLEFVNRLDKSPRFLIMESLSVAPQTGGNLLNIRIKFNAFVRESAPLPAGGAPVA
jgi:Tfp pilus assembly protein PilO